MSPLADRRPAEGVCAFPGNGLRGRAARWCRGGSDSLLHQTDLPERPRMRQFYETSPSVIDSQPLPGSLSVRSINAISDSTQQPRWWWQYSPSARRSRCLVPISGGDAWPLLDFLRIGAWSPQIRSRQPSPPLRTGARSRGAKGTTGQG